MTAARFSGSLSPTDSNGLKAQIERMLESVLTEQQEQILHQFSLDNKGSALSRLIKRTHRKQRHADDRPETTGGLAGRGVFAGQTRFRSFPAGCQG